MFRVVQFNLQFGQGWDAAAPDHGRLDVGATVVELRRHNPDIILLQEVEQAQPGGLQLTPAPNYSQLCDGLTGYQSCFAYPKPDARELPFGIGLAIFSRHPLRHEKHVHLPSPPISFEFEGRSRTPTDRLLIAATTKIAGRDVQLMSTHLLAFFMLGTSSEEQPLQRQIVADQLAGSTGPTILGGDFNVRNHAGLIDQFGARGYRTVQDTAVTWRRQPYVLDHVFHSEHLRVVNAKVVPTPTSDHHLVVADLEFV